MVTQPAYLRVLKEYARDIYGTEVDAAALEHDLENESDRSVVIIAATGIEDVLEQKIRERMPNIKSAESAIFGANGCIGTFSNKINVAYAFGIIDSGARTEIDLFREMRNACAHSRKSISFKVGALQEVCKVALGDLLSRLKNTDPQTLRMAYIIKSALLQGYIITGRKMQPEDMPDSASDLR